MRQSGHYLFCPHDGAQPRPAGKTHLSNLIRGTPSRSVYVRALGKVRAGRVRLSLAKTAVRRRTEPNSARLAERPPGRTTSVQHPGKARTLLVASVPKAPASPVPVWPFGEIEAAHTSCPSGLRLPGMPEEIPCGVNSEHENTESDRSEIHRFAGQQGEIEKQHERGARGSVQDYGGDSGIRTRQADQAPADRPAHGAHDSEREKKQQSDLQPPHQALAMTNGSRGDPSGAVVAPRWPLRPPLHAAACGNRMTPWTLGQTCPIVAWQTVRSSSAESGGLHAAGTFHAGL